jgi:hypothetical protein
LFYRITSWIQNKMKKDKSDLEIKIERDEKWRENERSKKHE